ARRRTSAPWAAGWPRIPRRSPDLHARVPPPNRCAPTAMCCAVSPLHFHRFLVGGDPLRVATGSRVARSDGLAGPPLTRWPRAGQCGGEEDRFALYWLYAV